ncbi:MAG: amidohydrolase family protein [Deltaproteobacteria bacterium]|nr:amidohydrolase family protein [Deltaproteobacteria bacterium]MBW2017021.1 amidohydrolase family protein [Deltaproteobacteria bacterium]
MKIDCHCHVFDNDCVPVGGMLASRFGISLSRKAGEWIKKVKGGAEWTSIGNLLSFENFFFDVLALFRQAADRQEKDSLFAVLKSPGDFLAFMKIGRLGIKKIAMELMRRAPQMDVWVPLMVDMSHAYPGSGSARTYETQKEIMSGLVLEAGGRFMPFYGFDPRGKDALDKAVRAIEGQGFVGIKLYPPLGFKPAENEEPGVEEALWNLYAFCCDSRPAIPITVHCSWSAGVYSNEHRPGIGNPKSYYRHLADPAHWRPVFARFPRLKVNFAHFGGLGEWAALAAGDTPRERWSDTILEFMRDYENVYTDLSFHGVVTSPLADGYRKVLEKRIRGVEGKVLLGSDWYMLRIQCPLQNYWRSFETLIPDLYERAVGENAFKFLASRATEEYFPRFFTVNQRDLPKAYREPFNGAVPSSG